jgi:hypothetical protein
MNNRDELLAERMRGDRGNMGSLIHREYIRDSHGYQIRIWDRALQWLSDYYGHRHYEIFSVDDQYKLMRPYAEEVKCVLGVDEFDLNRCSIIWSCSEFSLIVYFHGSVFNMDSVDVFFDVDELVLVQMILEI